MQYKANSGTILIETNTPHWLTFDIISFDEDNRSTALRSMGRRLLGALKIVAVIFLGFLSGTGFTIHKAMPTSIKSPYWLSPLLVSTRSYYPRNLVSLRLVPEWQELGII